jgi:hypothetical protein
MIQDAPAWSGRQLLYDRKARIDVNPTCGGYLESYVSTLTGCTSELKKERCLGG